jgi:hypothetical protein
LAPWDVTSTARATLCVPRGSAVSTWPDPIPAKAQTILWSIGADEGLFFYWHIDRYLLYHYYFFYYYYADDPLPKAYEIFQQLTQYRLEP